MGDHFQGLPTNKIPKKREIRFPIKPISKCQNITQEPWLDPCRTINSSGINWGYNNYNNSRPKRRYKPHRSRGSS
jgi:hypothetical protein